MNKLGHYVLLLCIVISMGCSAGDVDLEPPTFNVLNFIPSPVEGEICGSQEPSVFLLTGGDDLGFEATFEDDLALSQYKVDIHNNFDCHGHGGGIAPSVAIPEISNQTIDWSINEDQIISGNSVSANRSFTVPENVTAGNYHFHIQVLDEAGNDSPFANFYSLKIKNPTDDVAPQITVQDPLENNLSVNKGESIHFAGQVTDNFSLSQGGNGVLYLAYTDLSSGNTFTTNRIFPFHETIGTEFDFDFDYVIPQTWVEGNYRFSLGATDGVRNVASFVFFDAAVN